MRRRKSLRNGVHHANGSYGNQSLSPSRIRSIDLADRRPSPHRLRSPRRMARPSETEVAENAADDAAVAEETLTGFRKFLKKLSACFWELEEHLADLFGLNDSKYQTYVDEYFDEIKRKEDREAFERWEEAERQKELDAKLAEEQAKLEGGEGEDVGLTSAAAKAAEL